MAVVSSSIRPTWTRSPLPLKRSPKTARSMRKLLKEIADRPMRSWADYAQEIVSKLVAMTMSEDQDAPGLAASIGAMQTTASFPELKRRSSHNGTLVRPRFSVIPANDLTVSPQYVENLETPVRINPAIRYSKAIHGQVESDVLFFGPKIGLRPGHYDLLFDGTLDGQLELHAAANGAAPSCDRKAWKLRRTLFLCRSFGNSRLRNHRAQDRNFEFHDLQVDLAGTASRLRI